MQFIITNHPERLEQTKAKRFRVYCNICDMWMYKVTKPTAWAASIRYCCERCNRVRSIPTSGTIIKLLANYDHYRQTIAVGFGFDPFTLSDAIVVDGESCRRTIFVSKGIFKYAVVGSLMRFALDDEFK